MQPNLYAGIVLALIAAILMARDRVKATWWFFAFCQLFGATSVANLSALGGASLSVPQVGVIVLMCVSFFGVGARDPETTRRTVTTHWFALALIAYTLVISYFGPRLFLGKIDFISLRPDVSSGFLGATPLRPQTTNITQSAYLTASLLTAVAVSLLFARRLSAETFQNAMFFISISHATFGVIDWVGGAIGQDRVLNFLRNANYAMLDQTIGNIRRLSGTLPEPSAYAGFAVPFAVFATEIWLRSRKAVAGLTGLFLWIMTLLSTSSAGIFAVLVYAALAIPRFAIAPIGMRPKFIAAGIVLMLVLIGVAISLAYPSAYIAARDFVLLLTVEKGASDSAIERGAWARQGWIAFRESMGIGVGAGSFRSSSLPLAVLGQLGVVGSGLMFAYVVKSVSPIVDRKSDYVRKSASWAAFFALVPSIVGGTTPDPGFIFALFAGFAMHPLMSPVAGLQPAPGKRVRPSRAAFDQAMIQPRRSLQPPVAQVSLRPPDRGGSESR